MNYHPKEPFKGDTPKKYPLYMVCMGLIKGPSFEREDFPTIFPV